MGNIENSLSSNWLPNAEESVSSHPSDGGNTKNKRRQNEREQLVRRMRLFGIFDLGICDGEGVEF